MCTSLAQRENVPNACVGKSARFSRVPHITTFLETDGIDLANKLTEDNYTIIDNVLCSIAKSIEKKQPLWCD